MRILQVSPFYPPHIGGIEFHVEALSRKLAQAGHEVVVYTSNVPRSKRYEVINGVEIHRFNSLVSPLNNPVMPGMFLKLLGGTKFDVIHAHGHFHMSSTFALLSKVFGRRPIVLTSHGALLNLRGWRKVVEIVFNKTIGRWTLKSVDRIIALSPTQADILEGLGAARKKMSIIPLWIDLDRSGSQADAVKFRNMYRLNDRKVVLFVGRLLPIKGLTYLIEAVKHTETKPAAVIIGGEAPGYSGTRQSLEQKVQELGLNQDVFFLGEFPKQDLGAAYVAADLFVLPSLGEGMPLALLEAMAYGKCVLATEVPGNRDVVKDGWNGLLVEPRNPVELAQKIDYLLRDDTRREKLGKQARQDIEQNYSSDVILNKILDVYHELQERHQ